MCSSVVKQFGKLLTCLMKRVKQENVLIFINRTPTKLSHWNEDLFELCLINKILAVELDIELSQFSYERLSFNTTMIIAETIVKRWISLQISYCLSLKYFLLIYHSACLQIAIFCDLENAPSALHFDSFNEWQFFYVL